MKTFRVERHGGDADQDVYLVVEEPSADIVGKVAGSSSTGWLAYFHVGRGRFKPRRNPENGMGHQHPTREEAVSWVTAQTDNR